MKNKLVYKFIFAIAASLVWSFLAISFLVSFLSYKKTLKENATRMYNEAATLANSYGSSYFGDNGVTTDFLASQMKILSTINEGTMLYLSPIGEVYIDSSGSGITSIPKFDPVNTGKDNYLIGDFYGIFDSEHLTVFYPVESNFNIRGYIINSVPTSTIRRNSDSIFNYNYLTFIITIASFTIVVFIFVKNISLPLKKLTEATVKYAKGDFSVRTHLKGSDEISRLSGSLDYMASEIEDLNAYQKKFIANISHDFRSPLTSIKGYLEAMVDGTIPPEMSEKYLNIVITETERLTKLTNNLLTMNSMNDRGMILDITSFDLVAVVKQVLETCEGVCVQKKIKFKLVFSDKVLNVRADKEKIQQVLYNLIDNAIKFSNTDSTIIISANEKNDKVIVSVKDFGIGIPKDSVTKVWDRFYKTDLSRGKDKKGTGLGLSIVKDIITAHKEYIDVISTEGVGTEFTFALPIAKQITDTDD